MRRRAIVQYTDETPISLPNSAAIARFRRVVMAAGVIALASASQMCLGVTQKQTQTTDAQAAIRTRNTDGTTVMVASGAITQYARVYAADSGKVSATGTIIEGIALQAAAADGDELEVLPLDESGAQSLFNSVAASTAVTASSTETDFDQNVTVPANVLKAGDAIEIEGLVVATATNSTDTLNVKLYIGATLLAQTGAIDVANNDPLYFRAFLTIRTIGATGTFVASGLIVTATAGGTLKAFLLASTAIDTTATQKIKTSGTWSTTNAGNSARLDQFKVTRRGIAA
jgi:hypothetical protein